MNAQLDFLVSMQNTLQRHGGHQQSIEQNPNSPEGQLNLQ